MSESSNNLYQPDLARAAIDALEKRELPATPEFFRLWVTYLAGADPQLTVDMDRALSGDREFTMADAERLHAAHFRLDEVHGALDNVGERMSTEIGRTLTTLRAAGKSTRAFGETLEGASGCLSAPLDVETHRTAINGLLIASKKMHEQNETLERRLEETRTEVHQLRANLDAARHESLTDALTSIPNRKRFDEAYAEAFERCQHDASPLSLVFADVDRFKRFNDTWGHQTGDQVLRFVAKCLNDTALDHHLAARYGGEEFAIVMPGATTRDAADLAEEMRAKVAGRRLVRRSSDADLGHISISLGVAGMTREDTPESLLRRADQMLYASKQNGRDRVTSDDVETIGEDAAA